jgi:hypothetical protein
MFEDRVLWVDSRRTDVVGVAMAVDDPLDRLVRGFAHRLQHFLAKRRGGSTTMTPLPVVMNIVV